jgi:jumonji domain-containing protein 7
LLPPICHPCVNEQSLTPATYVREDSGTGLKLKEDNDGRGEAVPFATWDPDSPERNATAYSSLAKPIRVTLDPGDILYLPAMW